MRGSPKGKTQRGQYLLAMGLRSYKWYQSQTPSMCQQGGCSSKGGRHEACISKDAGCHGHARPGHVAHGRMPMTSQTLVMSFHSSVFPFVILGHITPQKYHVQAI